MADLDEGAAHAAPGPEQIVEQDLSDEVQDFRFLAALSSTSSKPSTLPRRGEKDFEPHGTSSQQNVLAASRAAMHEALSQPRVHTPKAHLVGTYDRETGMTMVKEPRGVYFKTIGRGVKTGVVLWPEEALYLLERGTMDLRWEGERQQEEDTTEEGKEGGEQWEAGLPFSLQAGYATLIGARALTLERYVVYAGLKRLGYIVTRAGDWESKRKPASRGLGETKEHEPMSLRDWIYGLLRRREERLPNGPLVTPGLYRSYADVYKRLNIIPFHDPSKQVIVDPRDEQDGSDDQEDITSSSFEICYHVWKPQHDYKKSAPGEPNFRIAVTDARESSLPSLEQLDMLLAATPLAPPPDTMTLYPKLKHGSRHVILAVVDSGLVSYIRVADAGFGNERLYERATRGGNKGSRGGGRGRGRGRGGKR